MTKKGVERPENNCGQLFSYPSGRKAVGMRRNVLVTLRIDVNVAPERRQREGGEA